MMKTVNGGGVNLKTRQFCRTLIVDDELLIRRGIKYYFDWEAEGFQIVGEASNGEEALELIKTTNPHIILTDIVMPIMDGEELTRVVKSTYPHIEIIILSSFGEFNYVRSAFQSGAIDYILKPNLNANDLLQVLKKAANRISEFSFACEVFDMELSIEHIVDKLISGYEQEYDVNIATKAFPYKNYCLFTVDLRSHPLRRENKFIQSTKEKFSLLVDAQISQVAYYSFKVEQDITLFIVNVEELQIVDIIEVANKMVNSDPQMGVVISNEFHDFSKIGYQYNKEVLKLIEYRFYYPDERVLLAKNFLNEKPAYKAFNLDKFTDDLTHKRFDTAISDLKAYTNKLTNYYIMDVIEFKYFFENIIFNIIILLGNMHYDVKVLETKKYSFFQSIDEAVSASEVVEQLNLFINDMFDCVVSKPSMLVENPNINMLLEYIQKHYAEQLTLTSMAEHFHFHPSYLSSYFSAHNKEGFIEYLNKIRIEAATNLLEQSPITISEISAKVGYTDHSYFCKVFKKLIGMSPSKYRKKSIKVKTGLS